MSRSIAKHQAALQKAQTAPPPPPARFSNEEAERYYNLIMGNLPSDSWRLLATRLIVLQVSENQSHLDALNNAISTDGVMGQDGKPHPNFVQLVKVQAQTTAMLARLKALPTGDARELGRAAKFESAMAERAAGMDDDLLA